MSQVLILAFIVGVKTAPTYCKVGWLSKNKFNSSNSVGLFLSKLIPFFNGAVEIYAFAKKNLDYSY
jgi:hypothetical protein